MNDRPPFGAVRELLRSAFTAEELRRLCRYQPLFQELLNRFGPNDGLEDLIDKVIEFIDKEWLWTEFLDTVAEEKPRAYNHYAAQLGRQPVAVPTRPESPAAKQPESRPEPSYDDVEIHIGAVKDLNYPVHVQTSLVGDASGSMTLPWTGEDLRQRLAQLERGPTDRDTLADIGHQLFQSLFSGSVGNRYMGAVDKATTGLRLRLWFDPPELQALPWELLYDAEQDEFLALSGRVLITRYQTVPKGAPPLAVTPPMGILIVTAEPKNEPELDVDAEAAAVRAALAPLETEGLVRVHTLEHAQVWTLRDALRDHMPHVLHFVGHGNVGPDGGVLMLENAQGESDPLAGTTLATLLKRTDVRLAVLNACLSARGTRVEAGQFHDQRRAILGVGPALVRAGLGAVVANQFSMGDQEARLFAEDFYATLARFEPVDEAVSRAREALMLGSGEGARDWATPTLFLRAPDGVIFARG